jgi:hypothetical protein
MQYHVNRAVVIPKLEANWNDPAWKNAETGTLTHVLPQSKDHVPQVSFRVLHDDSNVYGIFQTHDRYVRSVETKFQGNICRDSCVEFFFKPHHGVGYFNLEMNAGGAFLLYYVRNHKRTDEGFADYSVLTPQEGQLMQVKTNMPSVIDPEITTPVTWCAQFTIPMHLLEKYTGALNNFNGVTWHANFYKCADLTSHPHWITWNPITETNYHLPECFGTLLLV